MWRYPNKLLASFILHGQVTVCGIFLGGPDGKYTKTLAAAL
jgi:hypothetical protein